MVPVLTEMIVTNLYQLPTLPEQVYLDISLGTASSLTYAVSIGLCMVPLLLAAWCLRKQLPALSKLAEQMAQHPPRQLELGRWRLPVSLAVWLTIVLLVAVPSINLVIKAGWQAELDSAGEMNHHWSLWRFRRDSAGDGYDIHQRLSMDSCASRDKFNRSVAVSQSAGTPW